MLADKSGHINAPALHDHETNAIKSGNVIKETFLPDEWLYLYTNECSLTLSERKGNS